MIIYGWNTKRIKNAPIPNRVCPHCQQKDTSYFDAYGSYVHIFWIPVFPYKKQAFIACNNCQAAIEESGMDAETKSKFKLLKGAVKLPVYMFSGLILIAIAIAFGIFSSIQTDMEKEDFITSPLRNDVYTVYDSEEPSSYKYYLMKVVLADEDSVVFAPNTYSYDAIPDQLDPEDGFLADWIVSFHREDLLQMYNNGDIKKIERAYSNSKGYDQAVYYEDVFGDESATTEDEISSYGPGQINMDSLREQLEEVEIEIEE